LSKYASGYPSWLTTFPLTEVCRAPRLTDLPRKQTLPSAGCGEQSECGLLSGGWKFHRFDLGKVVGNTQFGTIEQVRRLLDKCRAISAQTVTAASK
jgi:hypothetical protein